MNHRLHAVALCAALSLGAADAGAVVTAVGVAAFGAGSTLVDLNTAATNTEVNGLTIGGLTFGYSLGNGQLIIDGGPGITNNVAPQNIVSTGNPAGLLTVQLPGLSSLFGYGYALLGTGTIANGTTITLFNGATNVGSLSYTATPDPSFPGGFAGISSTLPFNRAVLAFDAVNAEAFAVDNFRIAPVPEAPTAALLALGVAVLALRRRAAAEATASPA